MCSFAHAAGKVREASPICDQNGNPPGCLEADCEYKPPTGKLNAVQKWIWGPDGHAKDNPTLIDVWATPTVGRVVDANCDGKVDELDPPNLIFVAANSESNCCQCTGTEPTACHTGALRVLDGQSGEELWTLRSIGGGSVGFDGTAVALGDLDGSPGMEIAAITGEGTVVVIDRNGAVLGKSAVIENSGTDLFGWGGGLSISDIDNDGFPEIMYGRTVFTTKGMSATKTLATKWVGTHGIGGDAHTSLSYAVDLDGAPDGHLEVVAGNTVYTSTGAVLWSRDAGATKLPDGFTAVADFEKDGKPEIVLVQNGTVTILNGKDGTTYAGPFTLPGTGSGGPPTVADFDGSGTPGIGVAMATFYAVVKVVPATHTMSLLWKAANHDLSSSVTGSSVFDFEGDGRAEVIYNDECFLWVFDGVTGAVRFAVPTDSFTATESSVVADVDGDGHAEIIRIANGSTPVAGGSWACDEAPWNQPDMVTGRPAWTKPSYGPAHRGVTVFGDSANSWVGTRTLWTEHAYHVTNTCDSADDACVAPNVYGSVPQNETSNWTLPWLDNFRQNVQQKGLFDAPDAIVSLSAACVSPIVLTVGVKNVGLAKLPAGVSVNVVTLPGNTSVGTVITTHPLTPGQTQELPLTTTITDEMTQFQASIVIDPVNPTFHECNTNNDTSAVATPSCPKP